MLANDCHVHVLSVICFSAEDGDLVSTFAELVVDDLGPDGFLTGTRTYLRSITDIVEVGETTATFNLGELLLVQLFLIGAPLSS